jgi:hypothetical protein
MNCYNCSLAGVEQVAVASCRHCSAGLCTRHVVEESQAVTTEMLINRVVELPVRARRLLCLTCGEALRQPSTRQ